MNKYIKKGLSLAVLLSSLSPIYAHLNYTKVNGEVVASKRLSPKETIYTDVAKKYTKYSNNNELNKNINKILNYNNIEDVSNINTSQEIYIPLSMLKTEFENPTKLNEGDGSYFSQCQKKAEERLEKVLKEKNQNTLENKILMMAIMHQESKFVEDTLSFSNAQGYCQIKEQAAKEVEIDYDLICKDPLKNIETGYLYQKKLENRFKNFKTKKGKISNKDATIYGHIAFNLGQTALAAILNSDTEYSTNSASEFMKKLKQNIKQNKSIPYINKFVDESKQQQYVTVTKQKEVLNYVNRITNLKDEYKTKYQNNQ